MNQQVAEILTLNEEMAVSSTFGNSTEAHISQPENLMTENTAGDCISNPRLYENLANDLFVPNNYEEKFVNTAYSHLNVNETLTKFTATARAARYSFSILQEWEGYVVSISNDTFTARLTDVTRHVSLEEEEADFPLDDLDDADRSRICEGSIFRWVIGYRRSIGGTKERSSRIVFRRIPMWTKKEINKNELDAIEWEKELNPDDNHTTTEVRSD